MGADSKTIRDSIRAGESVKINPRIPGLTESEYYISKSGKVYSLNGETAHEIPRKPGWNGMLWVTLLGSEGYQRYSVAELVARTFLRGELSAMEGPEIDYIVGFKDLDRHNNHVENLYWVHKIDAVAVDEHRRDKTKHQENGEVDSTLATLGQNERKMEKIAGDATAAVDTDEDALAEVVERLRVMRGKLETQQKAYSTLAAATQPFRDFVLGAAHRHSSSDKVVLEANKGRPEHSTLTVGDFVRLKSVMGDSEEA